MHSARLTITIQIVSVILATLGILSHTAPSRLHHLLDKQKLLIPVILLPVDQMQFVRIETEQQHVSVFLNILEIHMLLAVQSVLSIQTAHLTKHVSVTNALTHVLEHVELMQSAVS